jgi:hypothetical protein
MIFWNAMKSKAEGVDSEAATAAGDDDDDDDDAEEEFGR